MKIYSVLGYSGDGNATDQDRGHDVTTGQVTAGTSRVSGLIPASSTTPIQYIYDVHDCVPPTLQVEAGGIAKVSIKIYACLDRLAKASDSQTEASDARPAHWVEVTGLYNVLTSAGATALTSTAAVITNTIIAPSITIAGAMRPNWMRVVFTPDGTVATADGINLYSHATNN